MNSVEKPLSLESIRKSKWKNDVAKRRYYWQKSDEWLSLIKSQQQNEIYQDALRIEATLEETDRETSLYSTLESKLDRLKETEEYQAGFTADHSSSQLYATAVPFGMFGTLSIISSFYCGRREEEEYADNFLNKAQLI